MGTIFFLLIIAISLFFINQRKNNNLLKYLSWTFLGLFMILLIAHLTGIINNSKKIKVDTLFATRNNIIELVSASGKVQPAMEVKISPDVSGEIISLNISEGDYVQKGQLLLQIKRDIYLSILERSGAALNTAKANLLKTDAQLVEAESKEQGAVALKIWIIYLLSGTHGNTIIAILFLSSFVIAETMFQAV